MKKVVCVVLLCELGLVACDKAPPSPPVVVYAPVDQVPILESWLDESGIPVNVVFGDSSANTETIISKQDSPRADVLVASGIADLWRAADAGALRPIRGDAYADVPESMKDADRQWVAIGYRQATIGIGAAIESASIVDFKDLAEPEMRDELCLSTSGAEDNQVLIAMLIADMGVKPAERLVRSWIRNLARPPFATQAELLAALRTGECSYGVVFGLGREDGLGRIDPVTRYINIEGVGIARHAQNPAAAQALVDWMLKQVALPKPGSSVGHNIDAAGWHIEEARLLAERAGYR
jgi:iron(III) transport system substrate-binding protein